MPRGATLSEHVVAAEKDKIRNEMYLARLRETFDSNPCGREGLRRCGSALNAALEAQASSLATVDTVAQG